MTPETEAQWHQLARAALDDGKLIIAERCYAAVGNIAKAQYLHQVSMLCQLHTSASRLPNDNHQIDALQLTMS